MNKRLLVGVLLVASCLLPSLAFAQSEEPFRDVLETFQFNARSWQIIFVRAATYLFFTLAVIQLVLTNARLALRGADLAELIEANVMLFLGLGVMYAFLTHSYEWSRAVVQSFLQLGEQAIAASAPGAVGFDPAGIMQNGLILAGRLFSQIPIGGAIFAAPTTVALIICALVLLATFGLLAAFMAVAIVESYIVLGATVVFLGFGGSSWTSDIAKRSLMYCVSVGAKLFAMQLVVGVSMGAILNFDVDATSLASIGALLLLTVAIAVLAKTIPDLVQGMLNGASTGTASTAVGTAVAIGAAGVALGAGAIGAARAGSSSVGSAAAGASVGPNLARAAGHMMDAGAGFNPARSVRPPGLSGVMGGQGSSSMPPKPTLGSAPAPSPSPPPPTGTSTPGEASPSPSATPSTSSSSNESSPRGAGSANTTQSAAQGTESAQEESGGTIRPAATGQATPNPAPPASAASQGGSAPEPTNRGRVARATAGGAIGFAVAGPAGIPAGAALGALYGGQLEAARAKARTALESARVRFGLSKKE